MGAMSSRSPAMAYKDGEIWCSAFDEAGNRCWVNSQTGERTYRLVDGKPARRPSSTSSPYNMQSPRRRPVGTTSPFNSSGGQPWGTTTPPVMHSPGRVMHSPGHVMHSPGHVFHSNPGHVLHSPGHVLHSPGHVVLSPAPAALQAGYGAPQHTGSTMVPYHQPGHAGGVAAPAPPTPTATGEALGYGARKVYVPPLRTKKKNWMWTQH
eukprot:g11181.t1